MTGSCRRSPIFLAAALIGCLLALPAVSAASIIDESAYVPKGADIFLYVDMKMLTRFLGDNNVSLAEIFRSMQKDDASPADSYDELFNLILKEIGEIMMVGNTEKVESGSGVVVFISIPRYGKEITAFLSKKPHEKAGGHTLYEFDKQKNVFLSQAGGMLAIGFKPYLVSYLTAKKKGEKSMSPARKTFIAGSKGRTFYLYNSMSRFIKKQMQGAMAKGAMMAQGLDANVFIKALLNLRSVETSFVSGDDVSVYCSLASNKPDDAKKLEMISHFAIVGSSIAVSFSGMLPQGLGKQALTADRTRMERIQAMFGRIRTVRTKNGVAMSYLFTPEDKDRLIVAIKEELRRSKDARAKREQEKRIAGLFAAVEAGNLEQVKAYLAVIKDVEVRYKNATLLFTAVDKGHTAVVEHLISRKADVNAKSGDDQLAPLHAAAMRGYAAIASLLLEKGADINAKNKSNATPLQAAVKSGSAGVARALLLKNPDVGNSDEEGETALHMAAAGGDPSLVKLLLDRGANANALSKRGDSPLHRAAATGQLENVKILVAAGSNRTATNYDGLTPREEAVKNNHKETAEFLGN